MAMAKIMTGHHSKENDRETKFLLTLKGIPLGISLVLPGLSFGTTALILHLYGRILASIKNIDIKFLILPGIGMAVGLLGSTHFVAYLIEFHQATTFAFLFGLILFSTRVTFREIAPPKFKPVYLLHFAVGLAVASYLGYNTAAPGAFLALNPYISLVFSGMVSSMAMILPGLSGATFLVMLGIYDTVIEAVNTVDIPLLTLFALGIVIGLLLFSWILTYLLKRYRSLVMAFLTGMILGSALNVIPSQIGIIQIGAFLIGALLVYFITRTGAENPLI